MPKWLIVLLAIAALAGVIVLEQTREPFPAVTPAAATQSPAVTPPATVPTMPPTTSTAVEVPVLPAPETMRPQTPSEIAAAAQTPSSVAAASSETTRPLQTASITVPPVAPAPASPFGAAEQTPSRVTPDTSASAASPWAGLPLNEFLNRAAGELVRLSPETVTFLGLGAELGMRDDHLDPLTAEWEAAYYAIEQAIVDHLATYDLASETAEDRLNAEIYRTSLVSDLAGRSFTNNGYAVSSYMDSYPTYIEWFLTSLHPLETLENVEDYVARLAEIPARFRELEARLQQSEAIHAVPPRFMLEGAVEQLRATGSQSAEESGLYAVLHDALAAMTDGNEEASQTLLGRAEEVIAGEVLPSYLSLAEFVATMAARANDDAGVWKQDSGAAYYAYCLASQTTTDLTADEIYDLGLAEVERIQTEIRTAAAALGLDSTLSMPELFGRLAEETGTSLGEDTIARCQALIDDIVPRVSSAFLHMPTQNLVVVDGGYDTYFSPGTLDGSRPGQFFAPTLTPQPIYELPTVTYHEAVPGHGFQSAVAYAADIPPYIAGMSFTSFSEGWALYAERLAWEKGAYAQNPYGNLGRLQDELFRAVRLVVDPGLHAKQWAYEQAVEYMVNNTGLDEPYVRSEVERYIVTPGQAVTYKVGMLRILELREHARAELGDAFDLAEFHDVVLGHGELPLSILEQLVNEYVAANRK
jgi:uncharacterized protein (DUF885 family)